MSNQPLIIFDWHNAIMHIDADAFFVACEQATNPRLLGKPVVVGKERGIVTAASYEAKELGVKRGMRIWEVKRLCPETIVINSDYEKYSLFSMRMMAILRGLSPLVEEYSIDEAFVDITGLRRYYRCSYEELGRRVKERIKKELGISVSVGISLTKVLAKIASRHKKPDGLTVIPGRQVHRYLKSLPVEEVWGIGHNTAAWCAKLGIRTALEFARKPEDFVRRNFAKPLYEIWQELNGKQVYLVSPDPKTSYKSISKVQTFSPTADRFTVYAHLNANLDDACFKARRWQLVPQRLILFLRTQDYQERAIELKLTSPCAYPLMLSPFVQKGFEEIFQPGVAYRQTGVVLTHLISSRNIQFSLFEDPVKLKRIERLYQAVDSLKIKLGDEVLTNGLCCQRSFKENRLKIPLMNINLR
ncbi:MAG: DNA polymerase IV [candidate division WOR-3 bacterium]